MSTPETAPEPAPEDGVAPTSGEDRKVVRAAGLIGGVTLLSRALGMVRDFLIAYLFGATLATDAFWVSLRIPNTLRRFFGEGTLTVATVPVLREARDRHGDAEAHRIARASWTLFALILIALAVLGSLYAPTLVRYLAPGFRRNPEQLALAGDLLRITFPYIFFIGLVGLAHGILNAWDHFFAPAFHPILYNLAMIVGAFTLVPFFDPPVSGMCWALLFGGVLQLGLQVPYLLRTGFTFRPLFDLGNRGMRRILTLMGPAAVGIAVYQLNIFVSTILASLLEAGSISWLFYSDRLFQFPLGVFVIALGTAMLPTLSSQATADRDEARRTTTELSVQLILFLTIPSAIALAILAMPLVSLIFRHGRFDVYDTHMTALALQMFVMGLVPVSAGRILLQVFYSVQDTRTPVVIAAFAFAANLILSLLLMGPFGHAGLALATSLSAWLQLVLTYRWVKKERIPDLRGDAIARSALRQILASLVMGLALVPLVPVHGLGDRRARHPARGCGRRRRRRGRRLLRGVAPPAQPRARRPRERVAHAPGAGVRRGRLTPVRGCNAS